MIITIHDAIRVLHLPGDHLRNYDEYGIYIDDDLKEAMSMAVTALEEKYERENPKPLTIEELRQMDKQPVFVVPLNPGKDDGAEWCVMWFNEACVPGCEHWAWPIKDYGKTWTAYRHEPKED